MKENPHSNAAKIWVFDAFHRCKREKGITQSDLGNVLNISQPQARDLIMGDRKVALSEIPKLEDFFGLKFDQADNLEGIPLISWVSAGKLLHPDQTPNDWDDFPKEYAPDLDPNGDWIALRVNGRSMDKISPHDSIIFVNRNEKTLVPNACYVVSDGQGGATYKRWQPPNIFESVTTKIEEYERFEYDQEPEIIGRVRKSILKL